MISTWHRMRYLICLATGVFCILYVLYRDFVNVIIYHTIRYEMNMKCFLTQWWDFFFIQPCLSMSFPQNDRVKERKGTLKVIETEWACVCSWKKKFNFAKWHITMHMTVRKYARPWTPVSITFRCFLQTIISNLLNFVWGIFFVLLACILYRIALLRFEI